MCQPLRGFVGGLILYRISGQAFCPQVEYDKKISVTSYPFQLFAMRVNVVARHDVAESVWHFDVGALLILPSYGLALSAHLAVGVGAIMEELMSQ